MTLPAQPGGRSRAERGQREPLPSAEAIRAAFDRAEPLSVGIEDEVMILDPDTLDLVPAGPDVLAGLDGDPRFKLELPASQLEIVTPPCAGVAQAATTLERARRDLAEHARGNFRFAGAGVHPTSAGSGKLNQLERYEHTLREYGPVASRQLVCALQVHVAVGDSRRALQVYNVARSYLPVIAALAANARFYEGRDTGMASCRPLLGQLLPRQGVPPAIGSWEEHAQALRWGAASGSFETPGTWWWELRPHLAYGTLEFRVPDGQPSVSNAAAIAAVVQALVAWLTERAERGERSQPDPAWRIAENRWSAARHGVEGEMADLDTGLRRPTRAVLEALFKALEPYAERLGSAGSLADAARLAAVNSAMVQREVATEGGPQAVAAWLAERFLDSWSG